MAFRGTLVRNLRFKLKGFHDANLLKQARLRITARAVEQAPVWYQALEKSPPRPVPPRAQGKLKKLKTLKSPYVILSEKLHIRAHATQNGRDLVRGFGGWDEFGNKFTTKQMELIRAGASEKESYDTVQKEMEEQLEKYQKNIEEAYATIVEAKGGTSLSEFVTKFKPKASAKSKSGPRLPGSALRAGAKEYAFMNALDELGFVQAMKRESGAAASSAGEEETKR